MKDWQQGFDADPADKFLVPLQLAIESVTATHQLEAAVMTLSKCVRPLLLTGSLTPLHKDIGVEQVCPARAPSDLLI